MTCSDDSLDPSGALDKVLAAVEAATRRNTPSFTRTRRHVDMKNIFGTAIIAFISVWLINKGLTLAGLGQYKA